MEERGRFVFLIQQWIRTAQESSIYQKVLMNCFPFRGIVDDKKNISLSTVLDRRDKSPLQTGPVAEGLTGPVMETGMQHEEPCERKQTRLRTALQSINSLRVLINPVETET